MARIGEFPSAYSVSGDGLMIYSEDGVHSLKMTVSDFVKALGDVIGGMGGGLEYWTETDLEIFRQKYFESLEFRTLINGKVFNNHDVMTGYDADNWDRYVSGAGAPYKTYTLDGQIMDDMYGTHSIWALSRVLGLRYPALNETLDQPINYCDAHTNDDDTLETVSFHSNNMTFTRSTEISSAIDDIAICQDRHYFGKIKLRCSADIDLSYGGYINNLLGDMAPVYPSSDVRTYENFWVTEHNLVSKNQNILGALGAEEYRGWLNGEDWDNHPLYTIGQNWSSSKVVDFIFNVSCLGNIKSFKLPLKSDYNNNRAKEPFLVNTSGFEDVIWSSYPTSSMYFNGYNNAFKYEEDNEYYVGYISNRHTPMYKDNDGVLRTLRLNNNEIIDTTPPAPTYEHDPEYYDSPWYVYNDCTDENDVLICTSNNPYLFTPGNTTWDLNPAGTGYYVDDDDTIWRVDFIPVLTPETLDDVPSEFDGVPMYIDNEIRDHWAFDINEPPVYHIGVPEEFAPSGYYRYRDEIINSAQYSVLTPEQKEFCDPVMGYYDMGWYSGNHGISIGLEHSGDIWATSMGYGFQNVQSKKLTSLAEVIVKKLGLIGISPVLPSESIGVRSSISIKDQKGLSGGIIDETDNYKEKYYIDTQTGNFYTKGILFEKERPLSEKYQKTIKFGDTLVATESSDGSYVNLDVNSSSAPATYIGGDGIDVTDNGDNTKTISTRAFSNDLTIGYSGRYLTMDVIRGRIMQALFPIGGHIFFRNSEGTVNFNPAVDPSIINKLYLDADYLSQVRIDGTPLTITKERKPNTGTVNDFPLYEYYVDISTSNLAQAVAPLIDALPVVSSSDEGKILTVDSQGDWGAANPPDPLPTVSSSDNGKILGVSSGAWAAVPNEGKLPTVSSSNNGKILKVIDGNWALGNDNTGEEYMITSPVFDYSNRQVLLNGDNSDSSFSLSFTAPSDGVLIDDTWNWYGAVNENDYFTIITLPNGTEFKLGQGTDSHERRGDYGSSSLPIPKGMTVTITKNTQFRQTLYFIPYKEVSSFNDEFALPCEDMYSSYSQSTTITSTTDINGYNYTATEDGVIFATGSNNNTFVTITENVTRQRCRVYIKSKPFPIGKGQTVNLRCSDSYMSAKFAPFIKTSDKEQIYTPIPDYDNKTTFTFGSSTSPKYGLLNGLVDSTPYFVVGRSTGTGSNYISRLIATNMSSYDTYHNDAPMYLTRPNDINAPITTGYIAPKVNGYNRRWYLTGATASKNATTVSIDVYPFKKATKPEINIFDILPTVTAADAGKVLTVDSNGNWVLDYPSNL